MSWKVLWRMLWLQDGRRRISAQAVSKLDVFIDNLDLQALGFDGVTPAITGRPSYHPAVLLKLYVYGYLNRIQSSRRLA